MALVCLRGHSDGRCLLRVATYSWFPEGRLLTNSEVVFLFLTLGLYQRRIDILASPICGLRWASDKWHLMGSHSLSECLFGLRSAGLVLVFSRGGVEGEFPFLGVRLWSSFRRVLGTRGGRATR